ncbi:MAG: hypothetical protein IT292_04710 [Deltaproteobacteria bacterium]|nr:hypothetical protein [Deltaproteobacteria bacterium]
MTASLGYLAGYQQFVEDWNCCMGEVAEGIEFLICDLQAAGHRLAILSDNNPLHWEYCLEDFPRVLFPFVGHIFLSFQIGSCKPSSEAFRTVSVPVALSNCETVLTRTILLGRAAWLRVTHML